MTTIGPNNLFFSISSMVSVMHSESLEADSRYQACGVSDFVDASIYKMAGWKI